jgi:hypothetical protein
MTLLIILLKVPLGSIGMACLNLQKVLSLVQKNGALISDLSLWRKEEEFQESQAGTECK